MRWINICILVLISSTSLHAQNQIQEHCPLNGQSKTGGNPTITWTSYMVKTDGGICVERSVRTQGQIFINWPAADINDLWVVKEWSTRRCCFSDSTVKDGELEYGLLGSKLHTTVYQGHNEVATAGNSGTWMRGQLLSGGKLLNVNVAVMSTSSVSPECEKLKEQCRTYRYVITNSDAPLSVKWERELVPEFSFKPRYRGEGYVLDSGKTARFVTSTKVFITADSQSTDVLWIMSPDGKVIQQIKMPGEINPKTK